MRDSWGDTGQPPEATATAATDGAMPAGGPWSWSRAGMLAEDLHEQHPGVVNGAQEGGKGGGNCPVQATAVPGRQGDAAGQEHQRGDLDNRHAGGEPPGRVGGVVGAVTELDRPRGSGHAGGGDDDLS